jgi:hypothetical protein
MPEGVDGDRVDAQVTAPLQSLSQLLESLKNNHNMRKVLADHAMSGFV